MLTFNQRNHRELFNVNIFFVFQTRKVRFIQDSVSPKTATFLHSFFYIDDSLNSSN